MKYSHGNLEDLFYKIDPLKPEIQLFEQLQNEFDRMQKACTTMQPPDYSLANDFMRGINAIAELKNQEASEQDLLEWMAIAVNDRDRHRKYLKQDLLEWMAIAVNDRDRHRK